MAMVWYLLPQSKTHIETQVILFFFFSSFFSISASYSTVLQMSITPCIIKMMQGIANILLFNSQWQNDLFHYLMVSMLLQILSHVLVNILKARKACPKLSILTGQCEVDTQHPK